MVLSGELDTNKKTMKLEKQDDEEFEMLLGEIPHATSLPLQHHHHEHEQHHQHLHRHNVHVHGGHTHSRHGRSDSHTQTIHGMYDDELSHAYVCVSPVSGVSLRSEGSSSSSLSGGLSPDDDGSIPEDIKFQMPHKRNHYPTGYWLSHESELADCPVPRKVDGGLINDLGLSEKLQKMYIGNEKELPERLERLASFGNSIQSCGFQFDDRSPLAPNGGNVVKSSPFEECRSVLSNDCNVSQCAVRPDSAMLNEQRRMLTLRLQQQYQMNNGMSGICNSSHQLNAKFSYPGTYTESMKFPWKQDKEYLSGDALRSFHLYPQATFGGNCYQREIQATNMVPTLHKPSISDAFCNVQQNGNDFSGHCNVLSSFSSPHLTHTKASIGALQYGLPTFNDRLGASANGWAPQSPTSVRSPWNLEDFGCEDSFIIQGKGFVVNNGYNITRDRKKCPYSDIGREHSNEKESELDSRSHSIGVLSPNSDIGRSPRMYCPPLLPEKYNSLLEVEGYIYLIAKDQHGCRFLQRKFDEGTPQDVQMIFREIIDHVVELMMNPFGNYLIQKLLDVCNEEQRMQILLVVTGEPDELVKISLNTHGTRAVQKLIETLKTRQQILLVISALEPGFLDLIKDLNGNHVVQRCLQCLSNEDNKFIFDAAAKYCVDIATHRHGCCVLQRCISHSTGKHREKLVAEICANGLLLAQDAFGNYVVQYILDLNIPTATAILISQFEGNYAHLSTQKFSSNVVEKCLKICGDESRSRIIHELLTTPQFEQLLQHPFANYVIQSALIVSKGPSHASLVEAIRPHAAILRTSPYCKRIFSRTLLKK